MTATPPPQKRSVRWQNLFIKTTFWISAEIVLGLMGLDNLADYSEFLLQRQTFLSMTEVVTHLISSV